MPSLPKAPRGFWLEDAVAAALQCGSFIERNVHDNEGGADSLELDVIATRYGPNNARKILVEVKSGGWGFNEVFKLAGWMKYLSIEQAVLFATTVLDTRKQPRITAIGASLNIAVVPCAGFSYEALLGGLKAATCLGEDVVASEMHIDLWRYTFWIERVLIAEMRKLRDDGSEIAARAIDYYNLINDKVFFTAPGWKSADRLYSAFFDNSELAVEASEEIDPANPASARNAALQKGTHPLLQAIYAIQHPSRIAVLKSVVDIIVGTQTLAELNRKLGFLTLPNTFKSAIATLSGHKYAYLYPHFWQTFLWGWGGFILNDKRDAEYASLSAETGVPVANIPEALSAMDILFPTANTWFRNLQDTATAVILFPAVFRGIGSYRRLQATGTDSYNNVVTGYPQRMLVEWHNASVKLVESGEGELAPLPDAPPPAPRA
jgi:hypothetical protein